jgi:hypothetical protein
LGTTSDTLIWSILCTQATPAPTSKVTIAWSRSSHPSLKLQEENDAADLTPVLAASACASSTHPQHQKATGAQSPSTAEPSATVHEFSDDLTVNAGEPLSQIHSHPLDLDPMT